MSPRAWARASRLAPPARTPTISGVCEWKGSVVIAMISRLGDELILKEPSARTAGAPPAVGVAISRARPTISVFPPNPSGQLLSIVVVRRTEPGRRGGERPAP